VKTFYIFNQIECTSTHNHDINARHFSVA